MNKAYAMTVIDECNHAWKDLVSGEKERNMSADLGEEVKGLVRKLSKNSLSLMAPNLDEHHFDEQKNDDDEDGISF